MLLYYNWTRRRQTGAIGTRGTGRSTRTLGYFIFLDEILTSITISGPRDCSRRNKGPVSSLFSVFLLFYR